MKPNLTPGYTLEFRCDACNVQEPHAGRLLRICSCGRKMRTQIVPVPVVENKVAELWPVEGKE